MANSGRSSQPEREPTDSAAAGQSPVTPVETIAALQRELRQHQSICTELLALIERESRALRQPESFDAAEFSQGRKSLLPRLAQSNKTLQQHRVEWQMLSQEVRRRYPDVQAQLRESQELVMRLLVLDRENEQAMLRRGLVPTAQLPSANRQRPHIVAKMYRKSGGK